MVDNIAEIAAVNMTSCVSCSFAVGNDCHRDKRELAVFSQSYETRYTDEDFCGPARRYFQPQRCRNHLKGSDNG